MKIDRLIGILSILLQQEKVTAPYLAEKFEVSRRTINRDIEELCMAGIPLVTTQGQNGGISIMEGYCIDRTVLTNTEMQAILTGLRGLDSVAGTNKYQALMDKLSVGNASTLSTNNHIMIDLSNWSGKMLTPKIELIQAAIDIKKVIAFSYYAPKGTSERKIEPYFLIFQWSSWYVWGYCLIRKDFRLFKLNRMQNLDTTGISFEKREIPPVQTDSSRFFPPAIPVKALFDAEYEWLLVDEFGADSYTRQKDGRLLFQFAFSDKETLSRFFLGFGERAELLEPEDVRKEISKRIKRANKIYQKK